MFITYTILISLSHCLIRDLVAELPFILMHPKPEDEVMPPTLDPDQATEENVPVDTNLIQLDT